MFHLLLLMNMDGAISIILALIWYHYAKMLRFFGMLRNLYHINSQILGPLLLHILAIMKIAYDNSS
jgi:hypothetical protein